jgi:7,8-dihydropterin-6-yl-methyl-4-(beta-D-ribofuranosyl)aminobenzene 5'-phosphate synthase
MMAPKGIGFPFWSLFFNLYSENNPTEKEGDFMDKEMSRREFIKASAAAGLVLAGADILSESGSTAHAAVQIPEAEKVMITIVTDNLYDVTVPSVKIAKRYMIRSGEPIVNFGLHAEHGLAYHIETVVNGVSHSFLFDFGVDFPAVLRNMELLKIDFKNIKALVLSHGHWDHQLTLVDLMKTKRSMMPQEIPLYLGEEAFIERFSRRPDGSVLSLGQLRREDVEALGFIKIREIKDPTPIVPGAYATGKIEMVTEYEKGQPPLVIKKGDQYPQDFFIGEQGVVLNVKGKGIVVASGCAHRGIVNCMKQAQKITGVEKVHAVLGGFHLTGAKPEVVRRTIEDIKAARPEYIIPTHCTSFPAIAAFAKEMPDQFILSTVGTKFTFGG